MNTKTIKAGNVNMNTKRRKFNIPFVSQFKISTLLSILAVLGSLILIFGKGPKFSVDFRGGAEIQVKFNQAMNVEQIRSALAETNYQISTVQAIGDATDNEFLVKVAASKDDINAVTNALTSKLTNSFSSQGAEIRKTDIVGPKAGKQLQISGLYAMLIALAGILIYIGLRFDFKYAPGAVVALFHDVIIVCGIFVLFNLEFSLQIVAALLAVIGYSVNDTVVIYDRVREHEDRAPETRLTKHINNALNETLTRTIWTSMTTLLVVVSMYIFGGGSIKDFFFALLLGVMIGTYSSLYVAAPTVLFFSKFFDEKKA